MLLRHRSIAAGAAVALLTLITSRHEAHACGGGAFYPGSQTEAAAVSGHRVAISVSPTQTVLWDQIAYTGAPQDFAWIMPVQEGARVEAASDAWLEALDITTSTEIWSPHLSCGEEEHSGGCSCGSPRVGGGGPNQQEPPVTVVHQGSVGPYETVTIKSDTPGAISQWLTANGYNIPADVQPILDDYTAQGLSFIALRLKPDQGVQQMKPVRVITPGALTSFPMRMLSAGAQEKVAIKLFVITEGRVEIGGFPNAVIDPSKLVWDFAEEKSNYAEARSQTLAAEGGKTWLTTYAQEQALLLMHGYLPNVDGIPVLSIAQGYYVQGLANGEISNRDNCFDIQMNSDIATSASKVVNLCPPDGGACAPLGTGEIDSRTFDCNGLTDASMALTGLHPKDVWVTRFEAELPREALTIDLALEPVSAPEAVTKDIVAKGVKNAPAKCSSAGALPPGREPSSPVHPPSRRGLATITLTLAALAFAIARRARRERPPLLPVRVG